MSQTISATPNHPLPQLPPLKMPPPEPDSADEPLTPAGRLFLRPELDTIIHCVIGVEHHMDLEAIKSTVKDSLMVKLPRFSSLLVRHGSREYWRPTRVDIDRHVFPVDHTPAGSNCTGDVEKLVNDYIAELSVSTPLATDKPLWEIHVMAAHRCAVFRIHHALGDGISLMSLLLANCRKKDDPSSIPTLGDAKGKEEDVKRRRGPGLGLVGVVRMVLFSLVFCLEFVLRCLWVRDKKTALSGGAGVELWPRRIATAKFLVDDMKAVKNAVPKATINDVLFAVISAGLSRYLDHRSQKPLKEGLRITGVAMVNLRGQRGLQDLSDLMKKDSGSRWGNKFGFVILPLHYYKCGIDPLDCLRRAKAMIDKKKQSLEAHFSYYAGDFAMSWFGTKVACMLNYRILCNTSFTISNVMGPKEEITIVGNPIKYMRALTMHMVSYAGRADMQIMVAKDVIHDPEFLAKCFEDALQEMKEASSCNTISHQ